MIRRTFIPVLALAASALALAAFVVPATVRAQPAVNGEDAGRQVMQKIHDDLTAKGFTDVRVVPSSFIVSGTNKEGQPVMLLIGPNSVTVLTPVEPGDASQPPEQAQHKDKSLQNWE